MAQPIKKIVIDPTALKKKIHFEPSEWQTKVLIESQKKRFVVLCCGRRSGKSLLASYLALKESLLNNRTIWIVAPSYDLSKKVFDQIQKWVFQYFQPNDFKVNLSTLTLDAPLGSKIVCKSSENLTSLLGESVNLVILDEVSRIPEVAWNSYIRPCLSDTKGKAVFISTPFGKENHFYNLFIRGQSGDENWISFTFPSSANPFLSKEDLEEARSNLPEGIWKQEYEAQFSDSSYAVFRGVKDCIQTNLPDDINKHQQHRIFFGLDLAKQNDYSVLIGVDEQTSEVVYFDRFQKIPYTLQQQRIIEAVKKFKRYKIIVDSGSIGGSIIDELRSALGVPFVEDFSLTGTISKDIAKKGSKNRLIERLSALIESKAIRIPDNNILINELESFGLELSEKGNITYQAPSGQHDDCVIALALASWGLKTKEKQELNLFRQFQQKAESEEKKQQRSNNWRRYK